MEFDVYKAIEKKMPPEYAHATQHDLDKLIELQMLLGDPRQRVEVPQSTEGKAVPMPASRRYSPT